MSIRALALATAISLCAVVAFPGLALAQSTSVSYTYDALGRVVAVQRVNAQGNVVTVTYTYDPAGNRTAYTSTGGFQHVVVVPLLGYMLIVGGR
jgi:YD repeat-containing protein